VGLCARHPAHAAHAPSSWTPDNGNGTFTKPIFYDEFSDPDLIRVGDWFYLAGTTMHSMPSLPVLRFGRDGQRFTIGAPQPTARNVAKRSYLKALTFQRPKSLFFIGAESSVISFT
jgi:hypothetical protein